jgi:hypothetical protein
VGSSKLPPILLIQSRRDAATPYEGAVRLRRMFPASRLLTVGGGNHGVVLNGNACADRRMTSYLLGGALPAERGRGASCGRTPVPVPSGGGEEAASSGRAARIGLPFDL